MQIDACVAKDFLVFQWCEYMPKVKKCRSSVLACFPFHSAMHVGTVCQLSYDGAGSVLYTNSCGERRILPFASMPFLQIGQVVSFSICETAQHCEAVDLRAEAAGSIQWKEGEQNVNHTVAKRKEVDASSSVRDGPVLSQTRRLQRSIGVFHNADSQERLDMVRRAEDLLQQLLEEAEIDGDGICKLVRRCVGWLHVPIPLDRPTVAKTQDLSTEVKPEHPSEQSNLQGRVRRLLILALNALDLTDALTFHAVEEALNYIRILLQQAERSGFDARVARSKQWRQLSLLVVPPDSLKRKDAASSAKGIFQPSKKVMNLPLVFKSGEDVQLICSRCSHSIISSWFWRHPKTEKVHVLVPHKGHLPCSRLKKWPWIVEGNAVPKNDHLNELDFCPHHREKAKCRDCGGRQFCVHNRLSYNCKFCKTSRRTQRVERDGHFAAPVCQKQHKDSLSIYLLRKDSHLAPLSKVPPCVCIFMEGLTTPGIYKNVGLSCKPLHLPVCGYTVYRMPFRPLCRRSSCN